MIQAQTQKKVTDVTGYTPANPQARAIHDAGEIKSLHLDDVDNYQKRIYFWQNVPRRAKYNEIWNEVKLRSEHVDGAVSLSPQRNVATSQRNSAQLQAVLGARLCSTSAT